MKIFKYIKHEFGQAALVMVLVVMVIILIVIASIGLLTYNDLRTIGNTVSSSQSYYTSEAGIEDALYRIMRGKSYTASYNLTVGSGTTAVSISGPLTSLTVVSTGNVDNRVRKLEVDMGTSESSTDVAFNYGIQVGFGGLSMDNNAGVTGNVYSNGPITGGNSGSYITGTAISANGASAASDQSNKTPIPPTDSIIFANNSSTEDAAQSFQVSASNTLNRVSFYMRKISTPGDISIAVVNDNGGKPGSTTFATGSIPSNQVTATYGWVDVSNWSANPQLNAGVTYWIVLNASNNSSRYYELAANTAYSNGTASRGVYPGSSWTNTSKDSYFELFLGGAVGSIDSVGVGTAGTGDAWAHSVTNSNVQGTIYCQTGSGNNKACNTSRSDPTSQTFPISDANINQWKAEAGAGTVISGNYTPSSSPVNLGPARITGNLITNNDQIINVQGTLWIEGNLVLGNGTHISLDPAYGTGSGVIVVDGYMSINNGVVFSGSGQTGSYLMTISTNDCNGVGSPSGKACTSSNSAVDLLQTSQNIIVYAQNGQISVYNNASAYQVTGYKIHLNNNANIVYQTGLADVNFVSGPGAGFTIRSWKEIE